MEFFGIINIQLFRQRFTDRPLELRLTGRLTSFMNLPILREHMLQQRTGQDRRWRQRARSVNEDK